MQSSDTNGGELSFGLSHKIAQVGEAHTIGERLLKPCLTEVAKCLLNDKQTKKIQAVALSDNTVSRRIESISLWLENEVCNELKTSACWALQVDESTDVADSAILLAFVRYVHHSEVKEELLFCKALTSNATGEAISNLVDGYLTEHDISWRTCVDVCTDGAAAMTGRHKGFVTRVKRRSSSTTSSHCILHRESLAAKELPATLQVVLEDAIKVVNFITSRSLQSRLLKVICDEMGSKHSALLFHTEVRWLSRGRVLNRLFELRE